MYRFPVYQWNPTFPNQVPVFIMTPNFQQSMPVPIQNYYPSPRCMTPNIPMPVQGNIQYSYKWSDELKNVSIWIPRSNGSICRAELFGHAEWDIYYKKWYAHVQWFDNKEKMILNKRIYLQDLLDYNLKNKKLHILYRNLIDISNRWV